MKNVLIPGCILFLLAACGCVDIRQEVHVNHDGSGKIVEKISVLPRGLRLIEGMKKRKGVGGVAVLLTEESFQARKKAMGEVEVKSRKETMTRDGRKEIETVYTFKNLSKVNFWMVPTFGYKSKIKDRNGRTANYNGSLKLEFTPRYITTWGGRSTLHRETIRVKNRTTHGMVGQPFSSPSVRQEYQRVLPIFLDMFKDFHAEIVVIAPIESFEEPRNMIGNMKVDGNRVTIFEMDGRGVVQAPGMIHQITMNEVVGGRNLAKNQGAMPGVWTTWPSIHHGRWFRFMKSVPCATPPEHKGK
jgi:hypothetical protein